MAIQYEFLHHGQLDNHLAAPEILLARHSIIMLVPNLKHIT